MLKTFSGLSGLMVAAAIVASANVAPSQPQLQVAKGAQSISSQEKASVSGKCGCAPAAPSKPGYGFGTTGHYGPPGQGFTPSNNWRNHAAGDGLTPSGKALPPRAFN